VALRKPSDLFGNKSEDNNTPVIDSDNSLREELNKVESLSEQISQLQQELSQKVVQTDLEKLVLSQISSMQENFNYLQNDFRQSNKKDIREFKEKVSELTEIVGNLVENELPKYKKQVSKNEVRISEKLDTFKDIVKENIDDIKEELDTKVNDIVEVIDNNLEYFNNQLQETSSEVKKTTETYNKLSKIVESKVSKENEKLEEYSQVIQSLHEAFLDLNNNIQEENNSHLKIIGEVVEEKFGIISSDVTNRIDSIDEEVVIIKNKVSSQVNNIENKISSEISTIKADVAIFEKHNKNTDKLIQNFSEQLSKISELDGSIVEIAEDIGILQNQYVEVSDQSVEIKNDLQTVERYIRINHQDLIDLKEEVFVEIEKLPVGNLQENLERLEKKIDYIKETYSRIEPEVIVKEVIREGLTNIPPEEKTSDPLSPLNQNFVTLDQLQEHYRLFINRIQQQLSTLGGGGETRLKYLDDIVGIATNPSAYDGKFLKYNHSIGKFEFVTVSGGGGSSLGIATAGGTVGTGVTLLDFRGAGISTVTVSSGIATINIESGGGSSTPDISPVMMGMIF
jgi:chromosome segregation ATPase